MLKKIISALLRVPIYIYALVAIRQASVAQDIYKRERRENCPVGGQRASKVAFEINDVQA